MAAALRKTKGGLATVLSARRDAVATGEMAAALREVECAVSPRCSSHVGTPLRLGRWRPLSARPRAVSPRYSPRFSQEAMLLNRCLLVYYGALQPTVRKRALQNNSHGVVHEVF